MKKIIVLVLGILSITNAAIAANTSTGSVRAGLSGERVKLGVAGGLVTVGGDYGGSFLTGVLVNVDRASGIHLGLDTGIMFGSGTGLPILASLVFPIGERKVQPYIGASLGPVIGLSGLGAFKGQDGVRLAILLRPGLRIQVAEKLDLTMETSLGGLTGIFYISPMLGMSVRL